MLAHALAEEERILPRGTLSPTARAGLRLWREQMRLGLTLGEVRRLWEGEGTSWSVVLRSTPRFVDSPLDRQLPVVPFGSIGEVESILGSRAATLQGLAVDLRGWDEERRQEILDRLRPTRSAPPGELQLAPPAWSQDHRAPLRSLLLD